MTPIQIAQHVVNTKSVHLARERKDQPGQFDVKEAFTGKKRGWFYFDHFTASAVVTVFNALNPENQAKLAALPLPKLLTVCWKLVK